MDEANSATAPDLVRWTFTVDPDHQDAIETHLDDLGADVVAYEDGRCVVSWEEPEHDLDDVVEAIWNLNETPFDVISGGLPANDPPPTPPRRR